MSLAMAAYVPPSPLSPSGVLCALIRMKIRLSPSAIMTQAKAVTPAGSAPSQSGKAYCFLPLPVQTGLPLHLNAFFELSSNR